MTAYLNTLNNPWSVVDELMTDFPFEFFNNAWRTRTGQYPRINAWENEKGLVLEAEIAGVDPDKMDVSVKDNVLTITGEKEQANGSRAEFKRSFRLPFELADENIKATTKNGILTLEIPRKAEAEKRKIAIEKL